MSNYFILKKEKSEPLILQVLEERKKGKKAPIFHPGGERVRDERSVQPTVGDNGETETYLFLRIKRQ